MAPAKRALIIASPFDGLLGPLADAEAIKTVLQDQGFEIFECSNANATRRGILDTWQSLIDATSTADVVVIYYSGHGALIRPKDNDENFDLSKEQQTAASPFQILVPMDYDQTTATDFRGILNLEISYMLRKTTSKSENVTAIIDCCHSGRLFRDPRAAPGVVEVRTRNLPEIRYHVIADFVWRLKREGHFEGELDVLGNPHVVRIAASTTSESAMEYSTVDGKWRGAMTEALISAMKLTRGHDVSWRTILLHVQRLVQSRFPMQHPRAEGPVHRVPFAMRHVPPASLQYLNIINQMPTLHAGSVLGVQEGNVYSVMPLDPEAMTSTNELPEAVVIKTTGFSSLVELSYTPSWASFSRQGALAVLKYDKVTKLPVVLPSELRGLREAVQQSKYLQCDAVEDSILATFQHDTEGIVTLSTPKGIRIASQQIQNVEEAPSHTFTEMIKVAERLARAQRVVNLQRPSKQDKLTHNVAIEIGTAKDGKPDQVFMTGPSSTSSINLTEGDRLYIQMENTGLKTTHVSVFAINAAGEVSHMTPNDRTGYELQPDDLEIIGDAGFDYISGTELSWPDGIERVPVDEQFLVLFTSSPVDLGDLVDSVNYDLSASRTAPPPAKPVRIHYDILHISYTLHPLLAEADAISAHTGAEDNQEKYTNLVWQPVDNNQEQGIGVPATDLPGPHEVFPETELDDDPTLGPITVASRVRKPRSSFCP
ncbi:Caspase domain protein [Fusarium tjaetaba]|uniref:Caspase domain protein n=1 Tax=Fusarium tjaetaba TaxID=1567544 RepID=A0A8H5VML4_9HYPO|nr:Caspase domain protein [Fusarium tjaetaba]KAF5626374.1 Caspase domain protein [Fusarium tjaetaba]